MPEDGLEVQGCSQRDDDRPELGARAVADRELGADCVAHARMFFNSPDLGLDQAAPGTFSLSVTEAMLGELRRDYARMTGMIIGVPPEFDEVMASVAAVENEINRWPVLGHGSLSPKAQPRGIAKNVPA